MGLYHDPRHFDPTFVKSEVQRRRELAGRTLGSGPVSTLIALAWLLLVVVPYRLLRALVRLLVNALSQRPGRKGLPAGEDVAAQIRDQQTRR